MTFGKRIHRAEAVAAEAFSGFEKAMDQFEQASNPHRAVYNDIQAQISELSTMAAEANELGLRAQRRAEKLRELFE